MGEGRARKCTKMNWVGGIIRKKETIDNWIVGRGIKHSRGQVALPPKEEEPDCPERGALRNGNERKITGRVGGGATRDHSAGKWVCCRRARWLSGGRLGVYIFPDI